MAGLGMPVAGFAEVAAPGRHLFGAGQDRPAGDPEDAAPRL